MRVQDFPNVHSLMKTFFLKEGAPNVPPAGRLILFVNSWQKVTAGLVTLSYRYHPKFFSTSNIKEGGGGKNDWAGGNRGDTIKKKKIAPVQNKPEQFIGSIF